MWFSSRWSPQGPLISTVATGWQRHTTQLQSKRSSAACMSANTAASINTDRVTEALCYMTINIINQIRINNSYYCVIRFNCEERHHSCNMWQCLFIFSDKDASNNLLRCWTTMSYMVVNAAAPAHLCKYTQLSDLILYSSFLPVWVLVVISKGHVVVGIRNFVAAA